MARFFTDFTEYADGVIPSDWTAQWNALLTWERILSDLFIDPTYAPAVHRDSGGSARAILTWDDTPSAPSGNLEILTQVQGRNFTHTAGSAFRVTGAAGTETGYVFCLSTFGDGVHLHRYDAGADVEVDSDPFNVVDNTVYWLRTRLLIQGVNVVLRSRIWEVGDPEPGSWPIDYEDTSPLPNGPMGLWDFRGTDGQYTYQVGFATDGDDAPVDQDDADGGVGDKPVIKVGAITNTEAQLSTDTLSEYLSVRFKTRQGTTTIDDVTQTGSERFFRDLTGLTPATDYTPKVRVLRAAGWSPWSDPLEFRTLTAAPGGPALGCPPLWSGIHVNADANPPDNRLGIGWFKPLPGEPLSGTETIVLRFPTGGVLWNFELSADLGATWPTTLAANVGSDPGVDGDLLKRYTFAFDTTAFADGQNYRLRAVSQNTADDPVVSLSFPIDQLGEVRWWKQTYDDLDGRFGKVWAQEGRNFSGALNGQEIWVRGADGGIGGLRGHGLACFADLDVPLCRGADITLRAYVWSGEGGWLQLQGRDDTEGIHLGIGLFADGEGPGAQEGLFLGIENPTTWPAGCCDTYLTSGFANLKALGALAAGDSFTDLWGALVTPDPIEAMFFKATSLPLWNGLTNAELASWGIMTWREGPEPGQDIRSKLRSCARRYEAYTIRVRAEVQSGDATKLDVLMRVDGLGVEEPAAGYWHVNETLDRANPWPEGLVGLVSGQVAQATYGTPQGARVFLSWSALPLEPGYDSELEPFEPEWWNPPEPGAPCSLILQHYAEDRERVLWEVGTDPDHTNPYLLLPENYGEQEIDVVKGAATIGTVEVVIADRRQIPGDQDSGWLTERLTIGGVGGIQGRRNRLLRFISFELGWVVIADGPASTPQMDGEYAAYRWTIRDTRDTERKIKAFVRADTSWLFPLGVGPGFGAYEDLDGNDQWLVPPTDPIIGDFTISTTGGGIDHGHVDVSDYWNPGIGVGNTIEEAVLLSEASYAAMTGDWEILGNPRPIRMTWPNLELIWRLEGSGDPWEIIQPSNLVPVSGGFVQSQVCGPRVAAELADGTEVFGGTDVFLQGNQAEGVFPNHGDRVEVAIRYTGLPTEDFPLHIEGISPGDLLANGYDGVYSTPDPITGEPVPTGVRYNEDDLHDIGFGEGTVDHLLQEDDFQILQESGHEILLESSASAEAFVLLRKTSPEDDFRAWAEEAVYSPTGYFAALNNDGEISPRSQIPPDTFVGLTEIDNAIANPQPDWDGGERIVNVLTYNYPRWYRLSASVASERNIGAIDRLVKRDITQEFRDEASITRHALQDVVYNGEVFSAIGDAFGDAVTFLPEEQGYILSQLRRLYVFDRYRNAAPIIEVPVRRDAVATLRAGDWVVVDLSWFPDYGTARRGLITGGQILAIEDLDCEWRRLLIEEAFPIPEVS